MRFVFVDFTMIYMMKFEKMFYAYLKKHHKKKLRQRYAIATGIMTLPICCLIPVRQRFKNQFHASTLTYTGKQKNVAVISVGAMWLRLDLSNKN